MNDKIKPNAESQQLQNKIYFHVEKYWKLYATEGVLFIILGIAAYIIPHFVPKGVSVILGSFLLLIGCIQIIRSIIFRAIPGLNLFLFTGLFQFSIGIYFLAVEPTKGRVTLTMLLVILFLMEGSIKLCLAYMIRPLAHWNEMLFSGLISLLLVIVILIGWPKTAYWPLGLLLGVNMILFGSTLFNISLACKPRITN